MRKFNILDLKINFNKKYIIIYLLFINSFNSFSSEIDGIFIPQGKFDSALPTVTMRLDKVRPPVIRIAPSRPTVVIFPNQVSNCFSDNAALMTEIANGTRLNTNEQGVNFSSVVFKVVSKGIVNGEIPDQTVVNCQLIDANVYPIGVLFTDTNAYSVVKLLDKSPSDSSFVFDMDGYSAIRIGQKSHKIKEKKINNDNIDKNNVIPINKKIKTKDEILKEYYSELKKEDIQIVDNNFILDKDNKLKIKDKKYNAVGKNITIADLLEKKGFKSIKGE